MSSPSHHRHPNRHSAIRYIARLVLFDQYPPIRIPRSSRFNLGLGPLDQTPSIDPYHLDPTAMGVSTYPNSIIHGHVHLPRPPRMVIKRDLSHGLFPRHYRILPLVRSWSRTRYLGRPL